MQAHRAKIRQYVLQNFLFTDDASALDDDTSLIREGIVDSTGILELIQFLEDELGIRVANEEMTPANFDSLSAVYAFVERKRSAAGAEA